ncbi:hypothetical protein BVRB_6g143210 [Beta vulgaris subsp. vulgaris]|nr:hypothetical protein BVRB_6g143210 [Beta vulgaris subsp. vulgaris]
MVYPIQPPPTGFLYYPAPENLINRCHPFTRNSPLVNVNETFYFIFLGEDRDEENRVFLSPTHVRHLMRTPFVCWPIHMQNLYMVTEDGNVMPGFIPSLNDLGRLPEAVRVLIKWEMSVMDEEHVEHITVPSQWERYMDPYPNSPTRGFVFLLRAARCTVGMASFEDEQTIFHVMGQVNRIRLLLTEYGTPTANVTPFTFVKLHPHMLGNAVTISLHTPIINWNVRGATRPSFIHHLLHVINIHKPKVVVLCETRVNKNIFQSLLDDVGGTHLKWFYAPGVEYTSGSILMWDSMSLNISTMPVTVMGAIRMKVLFEVI